MDRAAEHAEDTYSTCQLCGIKENIMHFLFECGAYTQWTNNIGLHPFLIMCNVITDVPTKYVKMIMILMQDIN